MQVDLYNGRKMVADCCCMLVVVFCMNDIVELAVDKQYYQLIQGAL